MAFHPFSWACCNFGVTHESAPPTTMVVSFIFFAFSPRYSTPLLDSGFCICFWIVKQQFHMISLVDSLYTHIWTHICICMHTDCYDCLCCQSCDADLLAFALSSHPLLPRSQLLFRTFLIPSHPTASVGTKSARLYRWNSVYLVAF